MIKEVDSADLIRKLPAMIQGRTKFARMRDGGNFHVGTVDDWCLSYPEIVRAIEDYFEYLDTGKYRVSASVGGNWDVLNAYSYEEKKMSDCPHCGVRMTDETD